MRQHAQLRNDIGIFKTRGHGNVMYCNILQSETFQ